MERMLKVGELADMLSVSTTTVRRHIAAGDVHAVRIGNVWRIPLAEYERLRANGTA